MTPRGNRPSGAQHPGVPTAKDTACLTGDNSGEWVIRPLEVGTVIRAGLIPGVGRTYVDFKVHASCVCALNVGAELLQVFSKSVQHLVGLVVSHSHPSR